MAYSKNKISKPTSSICPCDEKYACDGPGSDAVIHCEECGSKQCRACNAAIHSKERKRNHERTLLQLPPADQLCGNKSCKLRNFAQVICSDCIGMKFCGPCFNAAHPSRSLKAKHQFISIKEEESKTKKVGVALNMEKKSEPFMLNLVEDENFETCQFHDLSLEDELQQNTPPLLKNTLVTPNHSSSMPDVTVDAISSCEEEKLKSKFCFHLLDATEQIKISSKNEFVEKIGCPAGTMLKVVSIFGNTGDGKSHTLNKIFFNGQGVFETSSAQDSCTAGAWAALDLSNTVLVIDTEGLLGVRTSSSERTRLLLKVLAISDVVIYRTRAERLHQDMFVFLNDSAKAYSEYFRKELEAANARGQLEADLNKLGPTVVIFHETQHTDTLDHTTGRDGATMLRELFTKINLSTEGFNSIHYVGTRTRKAPTDFRQLKTLVTKLLNDTSVRSPRTPDVIYHALDVLNKKFSGRLKDTRESFPDQYFTCRVKCISCDARCTKATNHDGVPHASSADARCKYQHQYENRVFMCKKCNDSGDSSMVVPKAFSSKDSSFLGLASYAWSGYVLECRKCGVIYRSRQYWYGNEEPDKTSVITEIQHVWQGANRVLQGTHNAARRFVDGLGYLTDSIADISAKPAKAVSLWLTDKIAPPYWTANSQITHCKGCGEPFNEERSIHHCRRCGEGFCDACSDKRCAVPERGWGSEPVRVCDRCYREPHDEEAAPLSTSTDSTGSQIRTRQLSEAIGSTVGAVASVVSYPIGVLKDSSRPAYWTADEDINECIVCKEEFGQKLRIHHCRACGEGVCQACSSNRCEVPTRGWDDPVRVCNHCFESKDIL